MSIENVPGIKGVVDLEKLTHAELVDMCRSLTILAAAKMRGVEDLSGQIEKLSGRK